MYGRVVLPKIEAADILHLVELFIQLDYYFAAHDQSAIFREHCSVQRIVAMAQQFFDEHLLGHRDVHDLPIGHFHVYVLPEIASQA